MAKKKNRKSSGLLFDNYKDGDKRDYMSAVYLGHKRQGKTSILYVCIVEYYNYNIQQDNPRTVLVVDPSEARGFSPFQEVSMDQLKSGILGNVGIYRINDGNHGEDVMRWVVDAKVTNIHLVVDEARNLFPAEGNLNSWQKALVTNHANYGIDISFVFHGFMDIHRSMRSHIWKYTIFKTPETPNDVKWFKQRKFPPALYAAWYKVAVAPIYHNKKIQYHETDVLNFDEYIIQKNQK